MAAPEPELQQWLDECPIPVLRREDHADVISLARAAAVEDIPSWHLRCTAGDSHRLFTATRTNGKRRQILLVNNGKKPIDFRLRSSFPLTECPLDSTRPAQLAEKDNEYCRSLAPFETVLLTESSAPLPLPPPTVPFAFPASCEVSPATPNLVRLNHWQLSLLDQDGVPQQTQTVDAIPLANQLRQGRFHYVPDIREGFGQMPTLSLPVLRLQYAYEFEHETGLPVELVMEPDSLRGDWTIQVNDSPALSANRFAPTETHVRGSLGCDLTPWLVAGTNRLAINLTTNRLDGGLRNPLYLAGTFGVLTSPLRLVPPVEHGQFEAYEENGLPHFSGIVDYSCELSLPELPQTDQILLELQLPSDCEEALELSLNGNAPHPMPWAPRQALVPREELKPGTNRLCLRVYTSLIRAFEGQRFDLAEHAYHDLPE